MPSLFFWMLYFAILTGAQRPFFAGHRPLSGLNQKDKYNHPQLAYGVTTKSLSENVLNRFAHSQYITQCTEKTPLSNRPLVTNGLRIVYPEAVYEDFPMQQAPITASSAGLSNRLSGSNSINDVMTTNKHRQQNVPFDARGDAELVKLLNQLPTDQQPFWFVNFKAIETQRNNSVSHMEEERREQNRLKQAEYRKRKKIFPMKPSTSNSLTAEEGGREQHRVYQAEYRKRKKIQQHTTQHQEQHQAPQQQQQLEQHQAPQQQHVVTAEVPMQPSTPNTLTAEERRREVIQQHQEQPQEPLQQDRPSTTNTIQQQQQEAQDQQHVETISYHNFNEHISAHRQFKLKFINNHFGYTCAVCDRLWFSEDLKSIPLECRNSIQLEFPDLNFNNDRVCGTCHSTLKKNKIPQLSKSNGFKYPFRPPNLPELDI